ncbi:MAG: Gfo/Idh/MocA family oxidoreductase [Limnohabitans sp.]|nr:Gfo/Idh/MocA family oxidoreductase [Limnohabitans sp.]
MKNIRLNVLIIGCGNIAGGYDDAQPNENLPLGHAKAYINHGGFELSTCIEPDAQKRVAFQKCWEVARGYESMQSLLVNGFAFDVISICSPTQQHEKDIQIAISLHPKLIFCEKPVTPAYETSLKCIKACQEATIQLAVNYSRRWSSQVTALSEELNNGNWGMVRSVTGIYNKGILNNGSHMIDLLQCLIGSLQIQSVGKAVYDHWSDDPSVDCVLRNQHGVPVHINVADARDYVIFELQIVTEKGVISIEDGGAKWRFRKAQPSSHLAGYQFLNEAETIHQLQSDALTNAVANIWDALTYGKPLLSDGSNALQAQLVCERIKQLATQAHSHKQTTEVI